jgi:hypothetical protein
MKDDRLRHIEEGLRAGAPSARRNPPPALHRNIVTAIGAGGSADASESSEPIGPRGRGFAAASAENGWGGRRSWRGRSRDALAAACVLLAVGVWGYAFLRPAQEPTSRSPRVAGPIDGSVLEEIAPGALSSAVTSQALAEAAGSAPSAVRSAIDGALYSEVNNIAHDATRAADFLLGRIPLALVTSSDDATR